jgi:hypothetical protein
MKTFKDNGGRAWSISVDVIGIRRVRSALNVNLVNSDFSKVLEQLLEDPVLLCDVIYILCKPEADKLGVSGEDFGAAMSGDAIEHAMRAFLEELGNFTPNPRDRARVQRVIAAMWNMAERGRDVADKTIEAAITRAEKDPTFGASSSNSPASSASTPAPSP